MYESPTELAAEQPCGAPSLSRAEAEGSARKSAEQHTIKPLGRVTRGLLAFAGLVSAGAGIVGMVIPILPTTPFLLLAAFLFARSSSRLAQWLESTKAYRSYVVPFRDKKGMAAKTKARVLAISYVAMGVSAFLVRNVSMAWVAWLCLACAASWLFWFVCVRAPTLREE